MALCSRAQVALPRGLGRDDAARHANEAAVRACCEHHALWRTFIELCGCKVTVSRGRPLCIDNEAHGKFSPWQVDYADQPLAFDELLVLEILDLRCNFIDMLSRMPPNLAHLTWRVPPAI